MWESPIYKLKTKSGKYIYVDVTTSCAPNLAPNSVIDAVVDFFKSKGVNDVVDFGAGAFRHTKPFIDAGFDVWAVEFEKQFEKKVSNHERAEIEKLPNFNLLMFPHQFIRSRQKFDAAILSFVVPIMPKREERTKVLTLIKKTLRSRSYIFWMSQYGKYSNIQKDKNRVSDGWFLHPKREHHSFYTEFKNAEIDKMIKRIGFKRIRVLGKSGHDQFRLYAKGGGTWP